MFPAPSSEYITYTDLTMQQFPLRLALQQFSPDTPEHTEAMCLLQLLEDRDPKVLKDGAVRKSQGNSSVTIRQKAVKAIDKFEETSKQTHLAAHCDQYRETTLRSYMKLDI